MTPKDYLREHGSNLGGHLKIRFVSASKDIVVGEMNAEQSHTTVGGRVHGGALMAFADTVAAYATILNLPTSKHSTTTIESKTNFLKAGQVGILSAEARPIHRGKTTMVWQISIFSPTRELVAVVMQTQMVLQPRAV